MIINSLRYGTIPFADGHGRFAFKLTFGKVGTSLETEEIKELLREKSTKQNLRTAQIIIDTTNHDESETDMIGLIETLQKDLNANVIGIVHGHYHSPWNRMFDHIVAIITSPYWAQINCNELIYKPELKADIPDPVIIRPNLNTRLSLDINGISKRQVTKFLQNARYGWGIFGSSININIPIEEEHDKVQQE